MNGRGISVLAAIAILLSLCACAGQKITTEDVALEIARENIAREERLAQQAADEREVEAIAQLDPVQQGMAYMAKQMKDLVVAVINKDKRSPMGFYDSKAAIAGQQNALIDKLTGRVLKASMVGGAIWAATDVAKHGMDKAGDRVSLEGDNNSAELNRVSSKSHTDTNQIGDGNNTGPSDAKASGPDKSSVTNNELAPEEPEIEEPEGEEGEFTPAEPPAHFDDLPVDIPEIPEE